MQDFSLVVSLGVSAATLGRFFVAHLRGERTRDWIVYVALLLTTPAWSTALAWTILRLAPDPYRLRS